MSKIAKQVTIMLLSVTCVFIALKLPVAIYYHVVGTHIHKDPIANSVLTNLVYVNSSINSFLYVFSGSKFQETVLDMFTCCSKKGKGRISRTSEVEAKETSVLVLSDGDHGRVLKHCSPDTLPSVIREFSPVLGRFVCVTIIIRDGNNTELMFLCV